MTEWWFKTGTAPSTSVVMVDFAFGGNGHIIVRVGPDLHVYLDYALIGTQQTAVDLSSVAVTPGLWYHCALGNLGPSNFVWQLGGQVRGPGGVSLGGVVGANGHSWDFATYGKSIFFSGALGIGVSLSDPTIGHWPNSASWAMSKLYHVVNGGFGLLSPASADRSGGDLNFTARQLTGSSATLTDSGSGGDATAGPVGLTIGTDGPYA
jgi:hypothetical protein